MILGKGAKSMNKLKISVASVMLFSFGIALAYAFPLEPTPVQMQKNFIECLEENLLNTQHDCMSKLVRR
jgi:hypothetical protein